MKECGQTEKHGAVRPCVPRPRIFRFVDRIEMWPSTPTLRILQVTDLHLAAFAPLDWKALGSVKTLATCWHPDLVACTGDLFGHRTAQAMNRSAALFDRRVGATCPWAFAWGNHDQELHDHRHPPNQIFDAVEARMAALPHCVYLQSRVFMKGQNGAKDEETPGDEGDDFLGGNYLIQVRDPSGEHVAWNLFFMNSRRTHHIPAKVMAWMRGIVEENKAIPGICFYHVPNHEYDDIWTQGIAKGVKMESVCFELDRGRVHEFLRGIGSIRACFVGHDHVNDYHGVLDGIEYVYGRKTCLGAYGSRSYEPDPAKEPKTIRVGGKILTLSLDAADPAENTLTHVTVFPDGSTWQP